MSLIYNHILNIDEDIVWGETDKIELLRWRYEIKKQLQILTQNCNNLRKEMEENHLPREEYAATKKSLIDKETAFRLQSTLLDCVMTRIEQLDELRERSYDPA